MLKERCLLSWVERDSLALKWFWPGRRAIILPFLVTLSLLVYDLFVFIAVAETITPYYSVFLFCPEIPKNLLLSAFNDNGESFGAFLGVIRYFKFN